MQGATKQGIAAAACRGGARVAGHAEGGLLGSTALQVVGGVARDAGDFVSQGRPFAGLPSLLSRRVVFCGLGLQGEEIALQGGKGGGTKIAQRRWVLQGECLMQGGALVAVPAPRCCRAAREELVYAGWHGETALKCCAVV